MSALGDLRRLPRSYPIILVLWVVSIVAALAPTLIATSGLSVAPGPDAAGALLIETAADARNTLGPSVLALLGGLALLWLASPLMSVAWLRALSMPQSLTRSLSWGAQRYLSAVASSLALLPLLLIAVAIVVGAVLGIDAALEDASAPTRDLWMLLATLPGLLALAVWAAWHDVARARIATGTEPGLSATLGALRGLGVGSVGRYALFFVAGLLLVGGGVVATTGLGSAGALVIGQLFVLGRFGLRGVYLAGLVRAAD